MQVAKNHSNTLKEKKRELLGTYEFLPDPKGRWGIQVFGGGGGEGSNQVFWKMSRNNDRVSLLLSIFQLDIRFHMPLVKK